jgi:hypothetical protein
MRYLYGDLKPFPPQENTLQILRRFVDMAVGVLKLHHEIEQDHQTIGDDEAFLRETLREIDLFHQAIKESIAKTSAHLEPDHVLSVLAQGISDHVTKYIQDTQGKVSQKVEADIQKTRSEIQKYSQQLFGLLKEFYVPGALPIASNSLECSLVGEAYQATSDIQDVTGVQCSYGLTAPAVEFFASAKRLGDVLQKKAVFPTRTKKGWLRKDENPVYLKVDEATLTRVVDRDEYAEFDLFRRKGSEPEGLRCRITKGSEPKLSVLHLDAASQTQPIPEEIIQPVHTEPLLEFWRHLQPAVLSLYRQQSALSSIRIDARDVLQERLAGELVLRLVRYLSPVVREIDARSPAAEELCLKIEHDDGKREEIYISKKSITDRLVELPEELRSVFRPLGLDQKR